MCMCVCTCAVHHSSKPLLILCTSYSLYIQTGKRILHMVYVLSCKLQHSAWHTTTIVRTFRWMSQVYIHTFNWDPTSAQAALDDRYHGNTMWRAQAAFDDCYHGNIVLWVLVCLRDSVVWPCIGVPVYLHWYAKFVLNNIQQLLVTGFVYTLPSWCGLTVGVVSRRGRKSFTRLVVHNQCGVGSRCFLWCCSFGLGAHGLLKEVSRLQIGRHWPVGSIV